MENELKGALADVKVEGSDPFAEIDKAVTPPSSSPTEKGEEGAKPDQGEGVKDPAPNTDPNENDPFHKRWQVREAKLREELEAESEAKLQALRDEFAEKYKPEKPSQIPKWFSRVYGDDPETWSEYSEYEKGLRDEIKQEVIEAQEAQKAQAEEEVQYWNKFIDSEIDRLVSDGKKFDRNEFIKVMLDYRPTDADGNLDFDAGYRILEATKIKEADPERSKARKQLADTTTKSSNAGGKSKGYMTPADFKGKSWGQL